MIEPTLSDVVILNTVFRVNSMDTGPRCVVIAVVAHDPALACDNNTVNTITACGAVADS